MYTMAVDVDALMKWIRRFERMLIQAADLVEELDEGEVEAGEVFAQLAKCLASLMGMHAHVKEQRDKQQAMEGSQGNRGEPDWQQERLPEGDGPSGPRESGSLPTDAERELGDLRRQALQAATFRNKGKSRSRRTRRRRSSRVAGRRR